MIAGILFVDPVLYPEELVAILNALDRRLAVIKLFSLRHGIYEVPADVSPTGTSLDSGDFVIPLVTVSLKVSLESIEEFCRVIAVPGRGVSKQEDRRTTVFSAAEHPHEGLRLRPSNSR